VRRITHTLLVVFMEGRGDVGPKSEVAGAASLQVAYSEIDFFYIPHFGILRGMLPGLMIGLIMLYLHTRQ
jgi:hypothetical protein